jgi:hypothetical protein
MAAPDYVPPSLADKPREPLRIPPPRQWWATRPADLDRGQPCGRGMGRPGPDQGYGLALAGRFRDQLRLTEGEHDDDAIAAAVAVALRRASLYGRAPVVHDLALAFSLFGYLDEAPADLVEWRRAAIRGAAHDYWEQRGIVDRVPEDTLRLKPDDVRSRPTEWRELLGVKG